MTQMSDKCLLWGSVRSGSGVSPEGSNFSKLIKSRFEWWNMFHILKKGTSRKDFTKKSLNHLFRLFLKCPESPGSIHAFIHWFILAFSSEATNPHAFTQQSLLVNTVRLSIFTPLAQSFSMQARENSSIYLPRETPDRPSRLHHQQEGKQCRRFFDSRAHLHLTCFLLLCSPCQLFSFLQVF